MQVSFEQPEYTADADALGALRLLEAIRILGLEKKTRFYQASHLRALRPGPGDAADARPRPSTRAPPTPSPSSTPTGSCVNYREAYGIYACNGILFNHESPLRGETFVTRKITRGLARIKVGLQDAALPRQPRRPARLGPRPRLRRDAVAHAPAGEAAGLRHRHRRAVQRARVRSALRQTARPRPHLAGKRRRREGRRQIRQHVVAVDPRYFRPTEVETLLGDPGKARRELGWTPRTTFDELVKEMVESDLKVAERDALAVAHGFDAYNVRET